MSSLKERLAEKRANLGKNSGGYQYFAIKEGTTRMRHLPVGEEKEFAVEAVFFYLGIEGHMGVVSAATFGKKCAIMNAYNELSQSKDPKDRELAKKFKPQKKYFSPVIKYKDEKGKEIDEENGVKLLLLTPGMYQELIDLFLDEDEAGDFTDIKTGYDLKYKRTGKGKTDTEYSVFRCNSTPLAKKYAKDIYDPEAMLKDGIIPTFKESQEILDKYLNIASTTKEDDEEEETPRPKKKKKVRRDL